MTIVWWTVGLVIAYILGAVGKKMVGQQVETMLLALPGQLLCVASRRAGTEHRDELYAEWSSDLEAAYEDRDGKPLSQVWFGLRFSIGLIYAAPLVARERKRAESLLAAERVKSLLTVEGSVDAQGRRLLVILEEARDLGRDGWTAIGAHRQVVANNLNTIENLIERVESLGDEAATVISDETRLRLRQAVSRLRRSLPDEDS
jgi:hypothetical protein